MESKSQKTNKTSVVFSSAGVIIIGGLALLTLSRAFLAAKLESDVKRELESGPPKHMLDFQTLSNNFDPNNMIDPLASSLEQDIDGDLSGASHTEKFLDTLHFNDGGRKYIQRLVGGSISAGSDVLLPGGDTASSNDNDNEFNLDDDRSYSLWATNIDKMKLLWGHHYGLEDNPNIDPNPIPVSEDHMAKDETTKPTPKDSSTSHRSIGGDASSDKVRTSGDTGGAGSVSGAESGVKTVNNVGYSSGISVLDSAPGTGGGWKDEDVAVAISSSSTERVNNNNNERRSSSRESSGDKVAKQGVKWSDDAEELERLRFGPGSQQRENALSQGKPNVDAAVAKKAVEAEKVAVMLGVDLHMSRDAAVAQASNYFSEELPKHRLDLDLEALLLDAGGVKLANHAQGWFVETNNTNLGVMAKRKEKGRNVVFIKVAKAGGTTLQEVLQRYSIEHHLIVASPEHVKKETSFHRGKANILSRHCTLPNFLELKFIARPYFFVTVLRDPLGLAVSMFYWKHQEKRAAPYKYMRRFRQEEKGLFSDRHRAHIHVFSSQDEELRNKIPDYNIYGYMPQYAWFGDTVKNAIKELVMRSFLVGLVHRFDHLLIMLRYRLGVDVRQIIGVTTNHYRHPKPSDWPVVSLNLLNNTGKIQTDWKFMTAAERIYNKQVREFGSSRLKQEVGEYKEMMKNLRKACDPEGKEFRASQKFLPRCKPGQGQCIFDADKTVKCMLQKYDACAAGTSVGFGFCEREVRINIANKKK